jgi:hypothetical protein
VTKTRARLGSFDIATCEGEAAIASDCIGYIAMAPSKRIACTAGCVNFRAAPDPKQRRLLSVLEANNIRKMHNAIRSRNYEALERLIEDGTNVDWPYQDYCSPLNTAIRSRSSMEMALLFEKGAKNIKFRKGTELYFVELFVNHLYHIGKFNQIEEHHKLY